MTLVAKKVKAGLEDLSLGSGTDTQTRGDSSVAVTKIDTDWIFTSLAQIKALDTTSVKHAILIKTDNTRIEYDFVAGSALTSNDIDVLAPDQGTGRWLLRRVGNQQIHSTAVGVGGAAFSSHSSIPIGFILTVLYYNDDLVPGTGGSYRYTGVTDIADKSLWPADDGYYYDLDGKQFEGYDTANLPIGLTLIATTTYTFVNTDASIAGGKTATMFANESPITATIPPHSVVPWKIGTILNVVQTDTGLLTLTGGAGVTVEGGFTSRGKNHAMSAIKTATNSWLVIGGVAEEETVPVVITLNNHTLTNTNALASVALFPNGELLTIDGAGGIIQPNEWCVPRLVDIGLQYEARLTKTGGDNINQGAAVGVWFPISSLPSWGVQEFGTTVNFIGTLEIRLVSTVDILATCTIDLTSEFV